MPKPAKTTRAPRRRYRFDDLVAIMARLRGPEGCPWDRKQNHRALLPYLIEEAYEVVDSVQRRDMAALREELGDLLLQIVFHAQLADERGRFDITDVTDYISRKLIARHPHVFARRQRISARQVLGNWEKIKLVEKENNTGRGGVLDGVPRVLPALLKAYRLQEKTARFGFDWDKTEDVLVKLEEEIGEMRRSLRRRTKGRRRRKEIEHEMGDLLFALVNLARHLEVDAEGALAKANRRFIRRFRYIEKHLPQTGRRLGETTLAEMDRLWERAKRVVG